MTDDDLPTTREEAIDLVIEVGQSNPRGLYTEAFARSVCTALDVPMPTDRLQQAGDIRGITSADDDEYLIGIDDLLPHLVEELGGEPMDSYPYMGTGTNAQVRTEANLPKFAELVGRDLDAEEGDDEQ